MRHQDKRVKSIADVVKALKAYDMKGKPIWFRGQASGKWALTPSVARNAAAATSEAALLKRFKQNALLHLVDRPQTEWEWLFLMQHHGLPTRLLDWSESPVAALYFAVEDKAQKNHDAALWCLDPIQLNHEANIQFSSGVEIPAFDHDEVLNNYLPSTVAKENTSRLPPAAEFVNARETAVTFNL